MISQARSDLLAVLTAAGLRAFSEVADVSTPPMAVLVPSSEWIEQGEAFGEFVISFDVELVAPQGTNQAISLALDNMVETALTAITEAPKMYATGVGQPNSVDLNGGMYLGATITVKQIFSL